MMDNFDTLIPSWSSVDEVFGAVENFFRTLTQVHSNICVGNIKKLKKSLNTLTRLAPRESEKEVFAALWNHLEHPFMNTNFIILACEKNQLDVLNYLLDGVFPLLNFHTDIVRRPIEPNFQDGHKHTAFYYAIRSNCIKMIESLINRWPGQHMSFAIERQEELLAGPYEELRIRNVHLSTEMEAFVECKLIEARFFTNIVQQQTIGSRMDNVACRLDYLISTINARPDRTIGQGGDLEYNYYLRSVALQIHSLKHLNKSAYFLVPWDEMEFCLVRYLRSRRGDGFLDCFYQLLIQSEDLDRYLDNFSRCLLLERENIKSSNKSRSKKYSPVNTAQIEEQILDEHPFLVDFYNTFDQCKYLRSLDIIRKYLDLVSSVDPNETEGQRVITRALVVLGECFKNSIESPNMSARSQLALVIINKFDVLLTALQNSFFLAGGLVKRIEMEKRTQFFIDLKHNLINLGKTVPELMGDIFLKTVRATINSILETPLPCEASKWLESLTKIGTTFLPEWLESTVPKSFDTLIIMVRELSETVRTDRIGEIALKDTIGALLNLRSALKQDTLLLERWGVRVTGISHMLTANAITSLRMPFLTLFLKNTIRDTNPLNRHVMDAEAIKMITKGLRVLVDGLQTQNDENVCKMSHLLMKIKTFIGFDVNSLLAIEDLQKSLGPTVQKLCRYPVRPNLKKSDFRVQLETEFYWMRIRELKEMLGPFSRVGSLPENYKEDRIFQAALESVVFDILYVLPSSFNIVNDNQMSIGDASPLLFGKQLQNHLVHGNEIVKLLVRDPATSLILNAQLLRSFGILVPAVTHVNDRTIGYESMETLRAFHEVNFNIVHCQQELINSLKIGDLEMVKNCLKNGADVKALSEESQSSVHFAAMKSEECLKFIVGIRNDPINIKDALGRSPLHVAASFGAVNCVKFLLASGEFQVNDVDAQGRTPLLLSVLGGHEEVISLLLAHDADPSIASITHRSPVQHAISNSHVAASKILLSHPVTEDITFLSPFLHCAAESGSVELVEHLLDNCGKKVDVLNAHSVTPLHRAAITNHLDVVKVLISRGALVNVKCSKGITPLHSAAEVGNLEMVEELLRAGADPDIGSIECGLTPIFHAANFGNAKMMERLLERGAQVNVKLRTDMSTPLHWAASGGNEDVVKMLIQINADVNSQNSLGSTPLHLSADQGHLNASKLLIKQGALLNTMDYSGRSPIFLAARSGFGQLVAILIENGAHFNITDSKGMTPLHYACLLGHTNVVKIFVEQGSPINATACGFTCLDLAVREGFVEIVGLLLANGADTIKADSDTSPLHEAAFRGYVEIVSLLISKSAEQLDLIGAQGTPLHMACKGGKSDVAALLIERGCRLDITLEKIPSPLDLAIASKSMKLVSLLCKHKVPVHEDHVTAAVTAGFADVIEILLKALPKQSENFKFSLLVKACMARQDSSVRALILCGAEVNSVIPGEGTLLSSVAQLGYEDIVLTLLENGADPNMTNSDKPAPLYYAVANGNLTILLDLLAYGSKVTTSQDGRMPLEDAFAAGWLDIFTALLEHDPSIDVVEYRSSVENASLLHLAAISDRVEIVKLLVAMKADVHCRDANGDKAIQWAAKGGSVKSVQFFISLGMDVLEIGSNGDSLLHFAARAKKDAYIMCKYLILDKHLSTTLVNLDGDTPLHIASSCEDVNVVRLLLENRAHFDLKNSLSATPMDLVKSSAIKDLLTSVSDLFAAVKHGSTAGVKKALEQNTVVNVVNCKEETPLIYASWKGSYEIVDDLLLSKANPNLTGKKGSSPLHYACKSSQVSTVLSLLGKGAIFNLKNEGNKEPVDYSPKGSKTNKKIEIYSILDFIKRTFVAVENDEFWITNLINRRLGDAERKALFNCRNENGKSLIAVAAMNRFSRIEPLWKWLESEESSIFTEGSFKHVRFNSNVVHPPQFKISSYQRHSLVDVHSKIELANGLYSHGMYPEAITLIEEVINTLSAELGDEHELTLRSRSQHGLYLHRLERNDEAFDIFDKVLKSQKKILEPTDNDLLTTQTNLGMVLDRLGRPKEALEIHSEVYATCKQLHGEQHHLTLVALNNRAMTLNSMGKYAEALTIYRKVYELRKIVLGLHHPLTLKVRSYLVDMEARLGKCENDSMKDFNAIIKMQTDALGNKNRDVLATKMNAARVLMEQKNYRKALELLDEIYRQLAFAPPGVAERVLRMILDVTRALS